MKEIIEEVFQAEERINKQLSQARARAQDIKRAAEQEISQKIGETKDQARDFIHTSVEEAKKEAERIKQEKLKQADAEKEAIFHNNQEKIQGLVEDICNMILTTD